MLEHALQFWKGGLIIVLHNDVANEWGVLYTETITPKSISHEPLIKYSGQKESGGRREKNLRRKG